MAIPRAGSTQARVEQVVENLKVAVQRRLSAQGGDIARVATRVLTPDR